MSPIAKRLERTGRGGLALALRRLGRFWWIWIVLGQSDRTVIDGHPVWPLELVSLGLGVWGVLLLGDLAASLPRPWSVRMRVIMSVAGACLGIATLSLTLLGSASLAHAVIGLGAVLAFAGYVIVLRDFCATLPDAQPVFAKWSSALRWVSFTVAGFLIAAVFAGFGALVHQLHGATLWDIGIGVGVGIALVSQIAALLVTATATSLTRAGLEARAV